MQTIWDGLPSRSSAYLLKPSGLSAPAPCHSRSRALAPHPLRQHASVPSSLAASLPLWVPPGRWFWGPRLGPPALFQAATAPRSSVPLDISLYRRTSLSHPAPPVSPTLLPLLYPQPSRFVLATVVFFYTHALCHHFFFRLAVRRRRLAIELRVALIVLPSDLRCFG